MSLVVPGMWVTIARSSFKRRFRRLDLPALTRPTITVFIPSTQILPSPWALTRPSIAVMTPSSMMSAVLSLDRISASSSGKSIATSTCASISTTFRRNASIFFLNDPLICRDARVRPRSVLELRRSATASAWVRSILPFKKALSVNSPGSACLAPWSSTTWRIFESRT